jgi:hypothetical protein
MFSTLDGARSKNTSQFYSDYDIWRPLWPGSGAGGRAAVPEPTTTMLLLLTVAGIFSGDEARDCPSQELVSSMRHTMNRPV